VDDGSVEISVHDLVPGDIVSLRAGSLVPADVRLIEVKDLHVNQSALTGESFPVGKSAQPTGSQNEPVASDPIQLENLCFMGTSVVSGLGKAVVLATGDRTYFGNLAVTITTEEFATSFEKGLTSLSWLLIRFILGMVVIILLINGLTKGDWWLSFIFALSVGVGMTPELLPMIVTTNLSRGAIEMSGKKVIVKRLESIQNLGAVDVLCMDKTGTLTQNKVILYKHLDLQGKESIPVLKYAYLNSHFESGLKNLLDDAILEHAEQEDSLKPDPAYHKIDEIPFDFERRRLSVIIADNQKQLLICKGAVEEVLSVCSQYEEQGKVSPIDDAIRQQARKQMESLNQDGFRVIAIAYKVCEEKQSSWKAQDENNLVLLGFIAFLDPPKDTTAKALTELIKLGIEPKILTGDSELVTKKICNVVKLPIKGVMLGKDVESLNDEELSQHVDQCTIFARLNPGQKERIIHALRKADHVVGFLGDGINDSPAMNAADIGLSVNNAVDIAKESADMILMEESLMVLNDGVIAGRKVFGNIIKYIRMTTSSNFGNVFSMVGASFLLPFLPMKPIQILTQNLLYDFSQLAIPFDHVDEEFLQKPHRWQVANVERFMLTFGPVSSLFDYTLFGVMWFVFQANSPSHQAVFQTGWFIEGLLSQTLIVHLIRTRKIPFIQSWAAPQLIALTLTIMAIGIYLPLSPLARFFGFVHPPQHYFLWL
ncbi:MAG TPA: magnesium-translocating P-type ATPase, partial [Nitrospira sp.]|nr:magnesium-translocating P-type ATPase [Nitrospira sp.]